MQFLGRNRGESPGEVKTHLMTEQAQGSSPGTIGLARSVIENLLQQIQVSLHCQSGLSL